MKNNPVISTAKVRGIIKRNNIGYVDSTRRFYSKIANGINVWQLCDGIYAKVYGFQETERIEKNTHDFKIALEKEGFTISPTYGDSYEIVKVGA